MDSASEIQFHLKQHFCLNVSMASFTLSHSGLSSRMLYFANGKNLFFFIDF